MFQPATLAYQKIHQEEIAKRGETIYKLKTRKVNLECCFGLVEIYVDENIPSVIGVVLKSVHIKIKHLISSWRVRN